MEDMFAMVVVIIGAVAAIISASKKKRQQAKVQYPPIVHAPNPQKPASAAKPVSMSSMLPRREEAPQVAQPTVHTHLTPDCDVHDYTGSLNAASTEGKDPCHVDQMTYRHAPEPEVSAQPSLMLDWTGDAMVKAVVMQEVLTRPSQRRAR